MALLLDVNVLVALLDQSHQSHRAVFTWFITERDEPWASCPITENGFVRTVSRPRYASPIRISTAIERLRTTARDTDHEFWPDDISLLDPQVFRPKRLIGHGQITDACLLALVVKNGGRLVTLDTATPIDAVVGATKTHVVTPG